MCYVTRERVESTKQMSPITGKVHCVKIFKEASLTVRFLFRALLGGLPYNMAAQDQDP